MRSPTERVPWRARARGRAPLHHSQDSSPSQLVLLERPYAIPYRALLPLAPYNVIVAGPSISADRVPFGSLRVMSHYMAIEHAAGVAAGLALRAADRPADIDVGELQARLAEQGALTGAPGAGCHRGRAPSLFDGSGRAQPGST